MRRSKFMEQIDDYLCFLCIFLFIVIVTDLVLFSLHNSWFGGWGTLCSLFLLLFFDGSSFLFIFCDNIWRGNTKFQECCRL